jgi:hypothetical protein
MKNTFLLLTCFLFFNSSEAQDFVKPENARAVFGELKHEGPYLRSEILVQDQLTVSSGDGNKYEVASYRLIIAPKKGSPTVFNGTGRKLTPKMQGSLNQIVEGDRVLVEAISAKKNGNETVNLSPIVFTVKAFKNEGPYDPAYPNANIASKTDSLAFATFGSITNFGERHTLQEILKQTEIGVKSKEGLEYTVTSFKMIVAYKNAPATMASSNNSQFTSNMTKMLSRIKSGDRILIEGIRASTDIDNKTYRANLSPIVITVR